MPIDRNRFIIEDSIHKSRHLSNKTFGIAFQEEMKGQITADAVSIADDSCIGVVVFGGNCPCAAQQFHALVITIDGVTAVTERTDEVVGKAQCDNSIFCIACRSDSRVADDICLGKNFLDFTSNQVTGHIEIMDHHIEKNAARAPDIFDWRWGRVTTDDVEYQGLTNFSLFHRLAHAPVIGIEAPVKADLQFNAAAFYGSQGMV